MRILIYALALSCANLTPADALKRERSSFENYGKIALYKEISNADSSQLIQLLQNEETFGLIAIDDELSEIAATRATSLFEKSSVEDRVKIRAGLQSLATARKMAEESPESQDSTATALKKAKTADDSSSDKTTALLGLTAALTKAGLDITAELQKRRFEQRKVDRFILATTADAVLGNKERPITEAVALHTEAQKPVVAETLSENIVQFFGSLADIFKKDKK